MVAIIVIAPSHRSAHWPGWAVKPRRESEKDKDTVPPGAEGVLSDSEEPSQDEEGGKSAAAAGGVDVAIVERDQTHGDDDVDRGRSPPSAGSPLCSCGFCL